MTGGAGRVLLVAAWEPELRRWRRAGRSLAGQVVARVVGVGLVEAALGTARAIDEERPSAVVLVGTAGAFASDPALRQAACARRMLLLSHAVARGDSYFPPPLPVEVEADPDLRVAIQAAAGLGEAEVVCPLGITRSAAAARRVIAQHGAGLLLENLEAFAVARAAAAAALPFAAVLGVANAVGPDGHRQWRRSGEQAAASACDAVIAWLRAVRAPIPRRTRSRATRTRGPSGKAGRSPA
jgi:futalosine hydrolase